MSRFNILYKSVGPDLIHKPYKLIKVAI